MDIRSIFLLFSINLLGNLNAMQDVRIIVVVTMDKLVWSVIQLINFCRTLSALNPMSVKKVTFIIFYFI